MTPVLLISLYFLALTAFLGLDIISKVPATMYALVVATLGVLTAVVLVGALQVVRLPLAPAGGALATWGAGLAAAAAGAGMVAIGRLLRPRRSPGK